MKKTHPQQEFINFLIFINNMIKDIKAILKCPFKHWILNPEAIMEIISENKIKTDKNTITKLDVYKKFYK